MDRAGDGMDTEAVAHGIPFDVILLFIKHNKDKGGMVKLISGGRGGKEAVGSS